MAGFGWGNNKRTGNGMQELNHARKRPSASTQIACRICDQVFFSTQSLINHIETHMVENEGVFASRRQQNDQLYNNFTLPQRVFFANQRNPFLLHGSPATRLVPQVPFPPGVFGPQLSPDYKPKRLQEKTQWRMAAAEPAVDFTKPFLDQLQQINIPANHHVERKKRKTYDSETLDLTLKL